MAKIVAKALFGDAEKVEFVNQSSDARIPNITTGKVDMTCQFMTVTGERAQQVNFTIPYYREGVGLMLKDGGQYADYAALKAAGSSVTIAVLQNVYAEELVHKALPEASVDQYESQDLLYQALQSGARTRPPPTSRPSPGTSRKTPDSTRMPATAGARRPMPAPSPRATRTG